MAEPMDPNVIDEAVLSAAARHALHDEELIAALVDQVLEPEHDARARGLVGRCGACRDLHADLVATAAAHRASAAMTPAVPRDFRLTEDDARRLRPDLPVVRRPVVTAAVTAAVSASPAADAPAAPFLARVRMALRAAARPLGGSLVAAGLIGVLIGSVGFAGIPAAAPLPVGGDRQEVTAPRATGSTVASYDGGPSDRSAAPKTLDPRIVILAVSLGAGLTGLLILASTRRRAREAI